jgi:hypothetical protein
MIKRALATAVAPAVEPAAVAVEPVEPELSPVAPIKPESVPGGEELKTGTEQPEEVATEALWLRGWSVNISPAEIVMKPEANKPAGATDAGAGFARIVEGTEGPIMIAVADLALKEQEPVEETKEPGQEEAAGESLPDETDVVADEAQEVATE